MLNENAKRKCVRTIFFRRSNLSFQFSRYDMWKLLFECIMNKLITIDNFFQQHPKTDGRLGMFVIQKYIVAMRVFAYKISTDLHNECLWMRAQFIHKSVIKFVEDEISNFGAEYFRRPIEKDMTVLLMLGSIYYMHWEWKHYPSAWAWQYAWKNSTSIVILEAVASHDLWI